MRVPAPTQRRLCSIITVACLVLSLLGSAATPPATAAQSSGADDPVDPAALVPGVTALNDAGLEGMIPSAVYSSATLDQFLTGAGLRDDDELAETYAEAGFVRHYEVWWADEDAVVANRQGGEWDPISQVRFSVSQFDSDTGAADALAAEADTHPTIDDTGIDLGDGTIVFDTVSSPGGEDLDGIGATVQTGPFVVGVLVRTQEDSPVRDDEIGVTEELLEGFVDTTETLDDPPANALGLKLIRFDSPSLFVNVDSYLVRDGESIWAYAGESTSDREAFTENLVDSGGTSRYEVFQVLTTEEFEDEPTGYQIDAVVTSFEDGDLAATAFDVTIDGWEGAGYDVTELDDAPRVGDESVAFEAVDGDGTDFRSVAAWVEGTEVYRLYLSLPTRLAEPDALFGFVEAQSDCLDDGTCGEFQALPDAITDDAGPMAEFGPADEDDTPTIDRADKPPVPGGSGDDATPGAGDDDATPGANDDLATYEGEDYAFSVGWDETTWTRLDDYRSRLGTEGIRLDRGEGGTLFIEVIDDRSARDVGTCLEEVSDIVLGEAGVDDVEPALDGNGEEIAGEDDDFAFAGYEITFEGNAGFDYFGCATLEDGETAVVFIYLGPTTDDIDGQLSDVQDVIDTYDAG